jgi:uncharacterized membrane protein YphA (DoxX/SURF4 family)
MSKTHSFVRRMLGTDAGWGALALRIPAGIIFAAHGAQKLFGWFGGYGLEGTGQAASIKACRGAWEFMKAVGQVRARRDMLTRQPAWL